MQKRMVMLQDYKTPFAHCSEYRFEKRQRMLADGNLTVYRVKTAAVFAMRFAESESVDWTIPGDNRAEGKITR